MSDREEEWRAFVGKWRARWPEWEIAERFLPPAQRGLAGAWFALLQDWSDAAFTDADPTPGRAKLAWWQEELRGWGKGARRHPLGVALALQPADWNALATALGALLQTDGAAQAVVASLLPFGDALLDAETALFAASGDSRGEPESAVSMMRVAAGGSPLAAAQVAGTRPRRLLTAVLIARQHHGDAHEPLAAWRVPWLVWRAARAAAP